MKASDAAVDRQVETSSTLGGLLKNEGWDHMFIGRLRALLDHAVPFYWNETAFYSALEASRMFPSNGIVLDTDLIEPVQWWSYDLPQPQGDGPSLGGCLLFSGKKLNVDGVIAVTFLRVSQLGSRLIPAFWTHWASHHPWSDSIFDCCFDRADVKQAFIDDPAMTQLISHHLRFIASSILWTKSKVLTIERVALGRHGLKRAQKAGLAHHSVRTVTLRAAIPRQSMTEGEQREWSCRWSVRGHWRNQFMTKSREHRPQFISPFVKGPDDKPFRAAAIRYSVTR